jgi:hypothetical protein
MIESAAMYIHIDLPVHPPGSIIVDYPMVTPPCSFRFDLGDGLRTWQSPHFNSALRSALAPAIQAGSDSSPNQQFNSCCKA